MKTFRDLLVWQKAMDLVTQLYKVTSAFPQEELYGITSQIRRSGVSVPSNIAEGYGRRSTKDYVRYLNMATGSLYELETQLQISNNLDLLSDDDYKPLDEATREIERMITALRKKILESSKPK